MSDEILRYTDLATAIQLARATGLTTREIVRAFTGGRTHTDTLVLAKKAAPLLDITVSEFMEMRRNE
ncbi:MAG: hypothetical protein HY300_17855 [Verrucomicrobia bacterium]|nr:hypothetical protein [Verrucomicrobiota bacterium]